MEFKGTKGDLERVYVSNVCIGIGVKTQTDEFESTYHKLTANSIIPDNGNDKDISIMDADMLLYSKAPEMLEMLYKVVYGNYTKVQILRLLKEATTI